MNAIRAALLATLFSGCATEERARQLDERVSALEKKVAEIDKRPAARAPTARPTDAAPAAPTDPVKEAAAQKLFDQINTALSAGDMVSAKTQMAQLQTSYSDTVVAQKAKRYASELDVVGKDAPKQLAVEKWYQGETNVNMAGSKPVLVVFWEAWCPHCREEMPKLETDVWEKYKSRGLVVVALTRVTKSSSDEKVMDFVKENKITFPIAKDTGATASYFSVTGIPAAAVIKNGKVIWRGHPGRITDDMMNGWL